MTTRNPARTPATPRTRFALAIAAAALLAACDYGDNLPAGPDAPRPDARPGDAGACDVTFGEPALALQRVADGFVHPVDVVSPPGDPRMFVLELGRGTIRILDERGVLLDAPFVQIDDLIAAGFEQGILSLAFHPQYADNGRFYLSWARDGDNALVVEEWQVDPDDPNRADRDARRLLLEVPHDANFHYGSDLAFGADRLLYVSVGDGGPQFDPAGNGQSLATLRGKLLRIDVDHQDPGLPYAIPDDNPFVGQAGRRAEIWAYGLRNPWRMSIDPLSQHIYLGDVGFDSVEEIDVIPGGAPGGLDFGWSILEGATECQDPSDCDTTGLTAPAYQYSHAQGCAVIGGPVYRGCAMPGHHGKMFFTDFCQGWLRSLVYSGGEVAFVTEHFNLGTIVNFSAIGLDPLGEMLVLDYENGTIDRVVPAP